MTDLTTVVRPSRLPLAGLVVLSLVVALLAAFVVVLLVQGNKADRQRVQLACQVQRLGGQPVGGVNCPKAKATPRPAATVSPSPAPAPTLVVVVPVPQPSPAPAASNASRPSTASEAPRPGPTARRSPSASPSPSCTVRAPVTGTCVRVPPGRRAR